MVTISLLTIFLIVALCIVATYFITKSIFISRIADLKESHGGVLNALAEDRDNFRTLYNKSQFEFNRIADEKRAIEASLEVTKTSNDENRRAKDFAQSELLGSKKIITTLEDAIEKLNSKNKNLDNKLEDALRANLEFKADLGTLTSELSAKKTKVEALTMELKDAKAIAGVKTGMLDVLESELKEARESQLEAEGIATRSSEVYNALSKDLEAIEAFLGTNPDATEPVTTLQKIEEVVKGRQQLEQIYNTAKFFNLVFITLLNAVVNELPSSITVLDKNGKPTYPNLKLVTKDGKYAITNSTNRVVLQDRITFLTGVGETEIDVSQTFKAIIGGTFDVKSVPTMEALEANLISLFGNI